MDGEDDVKPMGEGKTELRLRLGAKETGKTVQVVNPEAMTTEER